MSKSKYGHSTLSGLIDSDDDDLQFGQSSMPTPDSANENKAPAKKGRGRPAMPSKVTKTKMPARRTSGRITAKTVDDEPAITGKKAGRKGTVAKGRRKVLGDKTNQQDGNETEEVDEFDALDDVVMGEDEENVTAVTAVAVKTTKPKWSRKKAVVPKVKVVEEPLDAAPVEDVNPDIPAKKSRATKKKVLAKKEVLSEPSPEKEIQETQPQNSSASQDGMDIDGVDDDEEVIAETIARVAPNRQRSRDDTRIHQTAPHRRAGSGSDTERSDPALRRKLGDITKKFENLNVKYQDLREIGLKEAERNFERLKKQSEEKTAASDKLIAALKADLAAQASITKESRVLKKKVESQATEIGALNLQISQLTASISEIRAEAQIEHKNSQAESKKIQTELKKVQAENKTISTKLAASRAAAASVESASTKAPGSAVKGGIRMVGSAEAALVAQAAQLKEDLYRDLTGLLIMNVTRDPEDDVFDCIQTGRNGTLHFKLAITNEKSAESYDDAQCQYVPQLDPSRDGALMEILPDYLAEEIIFQRPQAAKFYARVDKALTQKFDVD